MTSLKSKRINTNELFTRAYKLAYESKNKEKPWNEIFNLWLEAALNEHIRAQFHVGTCYDFGLGVEKNSQKHLIGI